MVFLYGRRSYGKVEATNGCFVVTQFGHLNYLPLFPMQSLMVVQAPGEPAPSYYAIPLSGTSVMAGYFRAWGVVGSVIAVVGVLVMLGDGAMEPAYVVLAAVLVASTLWAFLKLGKLSPAEHAQRAVYAQFAHAPVDVAHLGGGASKLRDELTQILAVEGRALSAMGSYRAPVEASDWRAVALDPTVTHPEFLRAALTLARIEGANAPPHARPAFRQAHDAIWEKLAKLPPSDGAAR